LTFDDWSAAHYYLVTPELQSRNINATFFIPTNAVGNWSQVQTVANYGSAGGSFRINYRGASDTGGLLSHDSEQCWSQGDDQAFQELSVRKRLGGIVEKKRKKGRKDCLFINQNQAYTLYHERCTLPSPVK
jgi:hypothetical protein